LKESKNFYSTASNDGVVKNTTLAIWILLIAESLFFIYLILVLIPISWLSGFLTVLLPCISLVVLVVPYLFKPKGFRFNSKELGIERPLNTISIPYSQISTVQRGKWTWKAVRLGGSGGLYGYLGLFHLSKSGRVWMYVTNRHKMVLIETENKKYEISTENPEDLVFNLQGKLDNSL